MPLDFPNSPTDGQIFTASTGTVYYWSAAKNAWRAQPSSLAPAVVSDAPPSNAVSGTLWYNSSDGNLYVYYIDSDSSQWVQIRTDMSFTSTIGPSVDSLNLRSPNYLINGAFDIWQRGTSFAATGYTADRWQAYASAGTVSITQSTTVPATAFKYSLSLAGTSTTAAQIFQRIESNNAVAFAGQTVTLSLWAQSTVGTAGLSWVTYVPTVTDNYSSTTQDQTGVFTATMTVGTWTRYSATFTVSATAVNGYQVTIFRNATTTSTTTLYAGVQLESGIQMGTFRRNANSLQGELAACQRYYQDSAGGYASVTAFAANTGNIYSSSVFFPVQMRIAPTVTFQATSGAANQVTYYTSGGSGVNASAPAVGSITKSQFAWFAGAYGGTLPATLVFSWQATAEL